MGLHTVSGFVEGRFTYKVCWFKVCKFRRCRFRVRQFMEYRLRICGLMVLDNVYSAICVFEC